MSKHERMPCIVEVTEKQRVVDRAYIIWQNVFTCQLFHTINTVACEFARFHDLSTIRKFNFQLLSGVILTSRCFQFSLKPNGTFQKKYLIQVSNSNL